MNEIYPGDNQQMTRMQFANQAFRQREARTGHRQSRRMTEDVCGVGGGVARGPCVHESLVPRAEETRLGPSPVFSLGWERSFWA